jgi:hypothetical protein
MRVSCTTCGIILRTQTAGWKKTGMCAQCAAAYQRPGYVQTLKALPFETVREVHKLSRYEASLAKILAATRRKFGRKAHGTREWDLPLVALTGELYRRMRARFEEDHR